MQRFRELWQNMSTRSKRLLIGIPTITLIGILVAVFFLMRGRELIYGTLFTGLSQDEAQQVVGLLQNDGVDYIYNGDEGSVKVPIDQADQLRARLLSLGYPKSGFAYDMYLNNAGLMTTESDKQQYTLYDLQDRLGATIRLFDGVRDAKVTIAEASKQTYVIEDNAAKEASASVVVTMLEGETLTASNAEAIKNLIARSVKGMNFTNVSVFDAATMKEVSSDTQTEESNTVSLSALTTQVEQTIAANVRRVLAKVYGVENVEVSVKGVLDMTKLIQESTTYSVPEKVSEEDKIGLLERESLAGESALASGENAAGVVGTDANADTPRYTNVDGTGTTTDGYSNSSATREWLYNVIKEQRELPAGVLQNTTVAVVINTNDTTISNDSLINLVADAAGISRADAADKITVLRAPRMDLVEETEAETTEAAEEETAQRPFPLWALIGAGVSLLLLLLILILILRRNAKKKKAAQELADSELESSESLTVEGVEGFNEPSQGAEPQEDDSPLDMGDFGASQKRMERSMKLKQNIGEFVDANPQVVAKLIQALIREEDGNSGRK